MIKFNPFKVRSLFTVEMGIVLIVTTYLFSSITFILSEPVTNMPLVLLIGVFIVSTGLRIKTDGFYYTDNFWEFFHLIFDIGLVTGISYFGNSYDLIPIIISLTALGCFNDNKFQIGVIFVFSTFCFQWIRNDFVSIENFKALSDGLLTTVYNLAIIAGYSKIVNVLYHQKYQLQTQQKVIAQKHEALEAAYDELFQNAIVREEIAAQNERLRLNGELQDHMGHAMASSLMQLQYIQKIIDKEPEMARNQLAEVRAHLKKSYEEIRQFVRNTPESTRENSNKNERITLVQFVARLRQLESKTGIKFSIQDHLVQTTTTSQCFFNQHQAIHLYRIVQELATNAIKHGNATELFIQLRGEIPDLEVLIWDNGVGCKAIEKGFGLESITNRVKEMDGTLNFETGHEKGFKAIIALKRVS